MKQSESSFQKAIIEYAQRLGYRVAHFRPARTKRGNWITPVAADGAGFPDLVLVGEKVVYLEVKAQKGRVSAKQTAWIEALRAAGQEAYVVRPDDWDFIEDVLQRNEGE